MSDKYLSNNKNISYPEGYNNFINEYINNKYTNITSNFKDNKILYSNIIINFKYNIDDINNLTFLSNEKELVIVFVDKDIKKLFYINIFNINEDSKNNINIENIMTIEWITKSNNYTLLYVILALLLLIIFIFLIYIVVKNINKNKNNNNNNMINYDNYQ